MLLSVENISFAYKQNQFIFENLSFELNEGEIITLLGPNGSGKSTLFDCLNGIKRLQAGQISILGKNLLDYKLKELSNIITLVSQHIHTAFDFNVFEYVLMGTAPRVPFMSSPSQKEELEALNALKTLGMLDFKERIFSELSGGERQQISIAKALAQNPKIILFDEPTSFLDVGNQQKVIALIKEMAKKGYAIIISTHNPDHAIQLGGRCAILHPTGSMTISKADELDQNLLEEIYNIPLRLLKIDEIGRVACISP